MLSKKLIVLFLVLGCSSQVTLPQSVGRAQGKYEKSIENELEGVVFKPLDEKIFLVTKNCVATLVDMNSGDIKQTEGDHSIAICENVDVNTVLCVWLDKNNKPFAQRELNGGFLDGFGYLRVAGTEITLSSVNRAFLQVDNITLDGNRIMGKKFCTGNFLYDREMKESEQDDRKI